MSAYFDILNAKLDETTSSDRVISTPSVIEIELPTRTIRMWSGIGPMFTLDGNEWVGWYAGDAGDPHAAIDIPTIVDVSKGTSPIYQFPLGWIDEASYQLLRDDADGSQTKGKKLVLGKVVLDGGSTRAISEVGDKSRLTIVGSPSFKESRTKLADGSHKLLYQTTLKAVNFNAGRSQSNYPYMTDTNQKLRSKKLYGVSDDQYGQFIPLFEAGYTLVR
ncbi:hypothetical protein [Lentilitoribacter sp. EG35]|uniref:hypothetical protein n=1 Tax=Lentilitoribacter sp. EG35 TaxID=3234192 RepID=UPI00345FAB06